MNTTALDSLSSSWTFLNNNYSCQQIEAALLTLEETRKNVVEMHCLYGHSLPAIADRLNLTTANTVRACEAALHQLRSMLACDRKKPASIARLSVNN